MKKLAKFQQCSLTNEALRHVKGGDDCHNSYSDSEVRFLMDANNWSERRAKRVLYLACKFAATP